MVQLAFPMYRIAFVPLMAYFCDGLIVSCWDCFG